MHRLVVFIRLLVVISSLCAFDINIWRRKGYFSPQVSALSNNNNVKVELSMENDVLAMINKAFQNHKNGDLSEAIDSYENVLPFLTGKTKANLHGNNTFIVC